jgi:hypothetical protein
MSYSAKKRFAQIPTVSQVLRQQQQEAGKEGESAASLLMSSSTMTAPVVGSGGSPPLTSQSNPWNSNKFPAASGPGEISTSVHAGSPLSPTKASAIMAGDSHFPRTSSSPSPSPKMSRRSVPLVNSTSTNPRFHQNSAPSSATKIPNNSKPSATLSRTTSLHRATSSQSSIGSIGISAAVPTIPQHRASGSISTVASSGTNIGNQ